MLVVQVLKNLFTSKKTSPDTAATELNSLIRLRGTDYRLEKVAINGSIENIKAALISDGLITPNRETFKELIKNLNTKTDADIIICLYEILIDKEQYLPATIDINGKWTKIFVKFENIKDQNLPVFVHNIDE